MPEFRLTYELTETRSVTIEAESDSAARRAWIDEASDLDANQSELVETTGLRLVDVDQLNGDDE